MWVLSKSLGPIDPAPGEDAHSGLEPRLVLQWAEALGLSTRLASRMSRSHLDYTLDRNTEEQLHVEYRETAARVLLLFAMCRKVQQVAATLGVPIVFLKGVALHMNQACDAGSRPCNDADILVDVDDARTLQEALVANGFLECLAPPAEHHLAPLSLPTGGVLEIHTSSLGCDSPATNAL